MNQSATTAIAWTLLLFPTICFGQLGNSEILESNAKFREEINHDYADSTKSPLTKEDFSKFSGLPFSSVWKQNLNYQKERSLSK
jgi:hypothetical protein